MSILLDPVRDTWVKLDTLFRSGVFIDPPTEVDLTQYYLLFIVQNIQPSGVDTRYLTQLLHEELCWYSLVPPYLQPTLKQVIQKERPMPKAIMFHLLKAIQNYPEEEKQLTFFPALWTLWSWLKHPTLQVDGHDIVVKWHCHAALNTKATPAEIELRYSRVKQIEYQRHLIQAVMQRYRTSDVWIDEVITTLAHYAEAVAVSMLQRANPSAEYRPIMLALADLHLTKGVRNGSNDPGGSRSPQRTTQ